MPHKKTKTTKKTKRTTKTNKSKTINKARSAVMKLASAQPPHLRWATIKTLNIIFKKAN